MTKLNKEEFEVLKAIVDGSSQFQPIFPFTIVERLVALKLARHTLGGPIKETDEGLITIHPEIPAILAHRRAMHAVRKKQDQKSAK